MYVQDLDKDFQERQAKNTGQPRSLWQEIQELGEEFVEFLEQEVSAVEKRTRKDRSGSNETARYFKHLPLP